MGYDVFRTARQTYRKGENLDPQTRLLKTAEKTGQVAAFHLIGTILIPTILGKLIHTKMGEWLKHPRVPPALSRRARLVSTATAAVTVLASATVINKATRSLLDFIFPERKEPSAGGAAPQKSAPAAKPIQPPMPPTLPSRRELPEIEWAPLRHPNTFQSLFA